MSSALNAASRPPSDPVISFVLASCNTREYVNCCIASIPKGGVDSYEIIVVDNASSDGTVAKLKVNYPDVRVVVNATNEGHCRAINQGMALARGEFILVLDADTILRSQAALLLVEFMRSRPDAAIAAPRMRNPNGTVQETARTFPSAVNGLFGRQSLITKLFPNNAISRRYLRGDQRDATQPFQVDWVSAAAMIFRSSLTAQIGFWDETIKGYWVDADWCKTAHSAGKVYCVPASEVTHFEQNRWGKKKGASRIVMFHAGAFRFYRKHFTAGTLDPRALAVGVLLAGRAALLLLLDAFRKPEPKASASRTDLSTYLMEAAANSPLPRSAGTSEQKCSTS
jgi:N-acetylglucosaminyl-diphospho-decaprenol L-rhamnosyltransferase